jgi:hypothetical protein
MHQRYDNVCRRLGSQGYKQVVGINIYAAGGMASNVKIKM